MKKLISFFIIFVCVCSVLLCGCTKANGATFQTIVELYQEIADANNINSGKNIFNNGNINENGAHFKITYTNENLNNNIAQINIAEYSGEDLEKYKRFELLSTLQSSPGIYYTLLNSVWYQFYFSCDRAILDNPDLAEAVPQEIKKNLYNYLIAVRNSLKDVDYARRTLQARTGGSTHDPISLSVQLALTEYFSKLDQLLLNSLKFNLEFEKALNYNSGELALNELPKAIQTGSLKMVLDKNPLRLSEFFIYNNIVAGKGLEKLSIQEKSLLNNFKTYFINFESTVTRQNISKFETMTGKGINEPVNIAYTNLRRVENEIKTQRTIFINSANDYKKASQSQKEYYYQNLNNYKSIIKTYYNYCEDLLEIIAS